MKLLLMIGLAVMLAPACGNDDDDDTVNDDDDVVVNDDDTSPNDDDDTGPPECLGTETIWDGECVPLPAWPDRVWVDGTRVRDSQGRDVLLRGLNLSTARKHPDYQGWHGEFEYMQLGDDVWGFTTIRHLIGWAAIMPEPGVISEEYLQGLDQRLEWAQNAGVYVILDMHQDIYGEGFEGNGAPAWTCAQALYDTFERKSPWWINYTAPEVIQCFRNLYLRGDLVEHDPWAMFRLAWTTVAERYADHPAVIGFDLLNEPSFADFQVDTIDRDVLMPFYEYVVEGIREVAPNQIIFFEPGSQANIGLPISFDEVPFDNAVLAPHYYQQDVHDGNPYPSGAAPGIQNLMHQRRAEADALGVGLWFGEMGGSIHAEGWADYMHDLLGFYDETLAGWAFWDYGRSDQERGFAVVHRDQTEIEWVLDALIRTYPQATAGHLLNLDYDPQTLAFTMTYQPEPGVTGPTELFVPARHYTNGYDVQVTLGDDEATYEAAVNGQIAEITVEGAVHEVEIRISPK